jgi:hypothetical protein
MKNYRVGFRLLVVLGTTWIGCGDKEGGGADAPPGRGSEACRDWQDAVCDFVSDECGVITRSDCNRQYQGVVCKSDQAASDCSNMINEATCTMPFAQSCDLAAVADPKPAIEKCEAFMDEVCEWQYGCDPSMTVEDCKTEFQTRIDCSKALAIKLAYETCMTELSALMCTAQAVPSSCNGVVLVAK